MFFFFENKLKGAEDTAINSWEEDAGGQWVWGQDGHKPRLYMHVCMYMYVNEYWIMIHVSFCLGAYKDLSQKPAYNYKIVI